MTKNLARKLRDTAKDIGQHPERLASAAEKVSMATGVAAGVAAAGAAVSAPTGLAALGVWLGLIHAPLIVSAAPVLGAIATAAGTASGVAYFYAQWKQRRQGRHPPPTDGGGGGPDRPPTPPAPESNL